MSSDAALLDRLATSAANVRCEPCRISRSDMIRLLALAQMGKQCPLWSEVSAAEDDPIAIMPNLVLMMIGWARGAASR
jgi:hypothetical protein